MPPTLTKLVVGYFPGWAIHARNYHISDIPADKLTHINYAFAGISDNGEECISINLLDDQINFPALQLLKKQRPDLRTLISVGGASNSNNFSVAAKKTATRKLFAQSCVSFMKVSGFDGIDIDWEFPSPNDKKNYTVLLTELRSQLDTQGTIDGKHYLLTAALPAGPDQYVNFELDKVHLNLDWVNLIAYNFCTASNGRTNFVAPLYPSSSDPEPDMKKRTLDNVDAAVKAYISAGVPPSKLVVGVPFSGHGWEGVQNINHGLYQPTSGPAQGTWAKDGIFDFEDLKNNYAGTYLRFWSAEASAPWLYNPDTGIMISYDDSQSVGLKADYVNTNNLAGMMIWQLSADDSKFSLLNALASVLNPSPKPASSQDMTPMLTNATRSIPKVTLVPLNVDVPTEGQAIIKFGYVRQLGLQPGEVDTVRKNLAAYADASLEKKGVSTAGPLWDLLSSFEGMPMPSLLPSASEFTSIPVATLQTFGKALIGLRKQALDQISAGVSISGARGEIASLSPVAPASKVFGLDKGKAQHLLNLSAVANKGLNINTSVSPIGMLNLERLEMTPASIERGELIATIPLAPGERTAVVQKEWSVTTKEFTSIVTDSLENYSETGVTDNTELTQSTTSQIQHANQFNITGTVSGGFKLATNLGLSGSASSSFGAQDSSSQSATESRKHAVNLTQKASSRTKQEHKVTISTTTVTGTSEQTTRELVNPSTTDPIRIDYFSLMRKWRVRLIRYGLRLTYDIVIPEPAGALRSTYARLSDKRSKIGPFTFNVSHDEITVLTYKVLADRYNAQVPEPPKTKPPMTPNANPGAGALWHFIKLEFEVPTDYQIINVHFYADVGGLSGSPPPTITVEMTTPLLMYNHLDHDHGIVDEDIIGFLKDAIGPQTVYFNFVDAGPVFMGLTVSIEPTKARMERWQNEVWNALFNAAQTQYYAQQQDLSAQISQLEDQLNNVDTLTLRREESDEIMKGVLRFILGPDFDYMPENVVTAIKDSGADVVHGVGFTGNELGLKPGVWSIVSQYEDKVRFINQAIEWENVVSFLYSYFWDLPDSWDFVRQIKHPDANRQAFLRAGSARVVLTVRKGWEQDWVGFVHSGIIGDQSGPYLTIAQEIAAYDDRNYPGIPPANPSGNAVRLEDAVYTTSKDSLSPSSVPVEIKVESSAGFLVGAQVVIDSRVEANYSDNLGRQESTTITAIGDATITVALIQYPHGKGEMPFPIVQPGEKGVLIAEWNEYTPTSGTDIAVTSNLATIA